MAMEKNFDAQKCEADLYRKWEDSGAFKAGANAKERAESFCIMIPPPNVTGSLHMGHAFNNTLQDILTRWHRMQGHDTLWQPGQDHAGIATQMVVERELAASGQPGRREMGREAFVKKVWEQKQKSGGIIIDQLRRLGASCDWSRNAFTMSGAPGAPKGEEGNFHDAVLKVFVSLYDKGLIYRGKRLVNWDPHFETAISDLEVEQVEVQGKMWRLRYPLNEGESYQHPIAFDDEGKPSEFETRDYLVVATTRPETMLGDTGVAVNPGDERYQHLIGKTVTLPLSGRSIPIVADDYADPEKGTGAVKITPAHDFNDWEVGKRCGLGAINVMTPRAEMFLVNNPEYLADCTSSPEAMELHGLDRYVARDQIIALAETQGWLDGIDSDVHMVPHGDRSKVAVEPYLTDQWFVDAKKLAKPAIHAVRNGKTRILPAADEKVYFHWMENIEPWCISRQLWWGHQVPVWYGPGITKKGYLYTDQSGRDYSGIHGFCAVTQAEVETKAKAFYANSSAAGDAIVFHDTADEAFFAETDGQSGIHLYRDPDVLDTWFSSGLWPFGTLGWPEETPELQKYYQTDVLITGFDIIFFWVARMMMMGLEVTGKEPFHTVYVHALVRDEQGKKMSKSLGNVIDPLELIDEFGADAVRFTLTAMAAMGRDLKLSSDRVQGYRNFGTKLWNAARFAEMKGCKPIPGFDPTTVKHTLNKWIIGETARTREAVDQALEQFRFNDAANALYAHVWGKVCDWYVELSKPLFQGEDAAAKAETQAAMAWAIDQCLIMLHPIMPFITEQLWGDIAPREKMLVHMDWPELTSAALADAAADREMNWVITLIEKTRSLRMEMHVPAGAKIPLIQLDLGDFEQAAFDNNLPMILRLARISSVDAADGAPKGAVTLAMPGGSFCLPLADVIDVEAEKARLTKGLGKLNGELNGLNSKLANEKFLANAPAEVVATQRSRAAALLEEIATLQAAFDRIAALG